MSYTRYQFKLQSEDFHKFGRILYITTATFSSKWPSFIHAHPFSEIFFMLSGEGEFVVKDKSFKVKENELIFVNANTPHTERVIQGKEFTYLVIGVEDVKFSLLSEGGKKNDNPKFALLSGREQYRLLIEQMLKELRQAYAFSQESCQLLYDLFIIRLIRQEGLKIRPFLEGPSPSKLSSLKEYIDENYAQEHSLDSLANYVHMNKFRLAHLFTKSYGTSPIAYLNQVRIKEASNLLKYTDHSIAEIADSVGFSSQSYFAQSFKQLMQLSASKYRKLQNASRKEGGKKRMLKKLLGLVIIGLIAYLALGFFAKDKGPADINEDRIRQELRELLKDQDLSKEALGKIKKLLGGSEEAALDKLAKLAPDFGQLNKLKEAIKEQTN